MKGKKLIGLIAALALCAPTAAFAACGGNGYSPKKLAGNISGAAESNGGFVATKGDYVYFINGSEEYTADNTLGKVEKGALMRISKSDLSGGKYEKAEIVVPALFVAQNFDAGIYLFGDYVYFASPTTEKERDGSVSNSYISFKRAKLDGSSSARELKKYFFRWESNDVQYRFTEIDGTVYCLYVDGDSALHSFNTAKGTDTVLVEGASSDYLFDENIADSGTVYYTMAVTQGIDTDNAQTVSYNQVYSVRADATATVSASECSYTVSNGYKYSFNGEYLADNLDGFKASDYTTYPYVNLGTLVLDGKGSDETSYPNTQFNKDTSATPATPNGYTYTLQNYLDGGLYLTRKDVNSSSSDGENAALYYLGEDKTASENWTSIAGNTELDSSKVALSTTNATSSAVYKIVNGKHVYMFVSDEKIYKVTASADGAEESKVLLVPSASSVTLWYADDTYLYYYSAGSNGNNLQRVDYTGSKADYSGLATEEKYKPLTILDVDWNSSWYKPEFVNNVLLFGNAKSFGNTAYNYIYAVNLSGSGVNGEMTYEELKSFNEKYEEVNEYIDEFSSEYSNLSKALEYWFRTGERTAYDDFLAEARAKGYKDHYRYSEYELNEFDAFTKHTGDYADKFMDDNAKYYDTESYFYRLLGVMKSADKEAIADVWTSSDYIEPLPSETEEDSDNTALIVVIVVASVIVVAAAVTVPVVISAKKKAKAQADKEATAVRKKIMVDTTDDKSIDVYAEEEQAPEEESESVQEEPSEEAVSEEVPEEAEQDVENAESEEATEETEAATEEDGSAE